MALQGKAKRIVATKLQTNKDRKNGIGIFMTDAWERHRKAVRDRIERRRVKKSKQKV